MSRFRYRDDESSSAGIIIGAVAGALAGFAAGMLVAQRVGGFSGLGAKIRRRSAAFRDEHFHGAHEVSDDDELEEFEEDELESGEYDESLEERVLEAFRNDPVLSERAIDIGSISEAVIELAGWVETEDEAEHAVTIARGVPGVETVVNRIAIGDEERRMNETAQRAREGDAALNEARWEGRGVGTGRRRQGSSDDPDRHAGPKVELKDRWQGTDDALRNAADNVEGVAERRTVRGKRAVRGDRTGGAPVSPTGVPKADHVAEPLEADRQAARVDETRDIGGAQIERGDLT
ncbi:MAG TPA: BON domain-containing protein [Gemmatimonadaceae bacterium]|nr:BON domain-containing protein [Gemmatimonadaceae bacterium]